MNTDGTRPQTDEVLTSAANNVNALASQIEQTVKQGKAKLTELQGAIVDKTKYAAKTTDEYVHENPWQAIGIAAGVGLVVGLLLRRR